MGREFTVEREMLAMPDGVRLAATYYLPKAKRPREKFPVLLEYLPYRKEDSFYLRDYPHYSYFARRGFVCVKLDVRGTGSSEGVTPDREYSEQELDDGVAAIAQLAKKPWSNGNVGMWGISWGGFNAIQIAMRQPPALKAILAVDAADNVYRDSVDYVDGAFHMDVYHLQIHHENGLPRPPDYPLDEAFFRDRFERKPWIFEYLRHQQDGPYWRKSALFTDYSRLKVPAYMIGGLLDGYRDTIPRALEQAQVPIQAEIGPWNHDFPHGGAPGPNYEWGEEATRWWNRWLRGEKNGAGEGKRFAVFVRDAHEPDQQLEMTPGHWRYEDWPIKRTQWRTLHPGLDGDLTADPKAGEKRLRYVPSFGIAGGYWWGDLTPDMRPDDAGSLVFDSGLLTETIEIVGLPKVRLRASLDTAHGHFIARLEDVHPDGRVSLVAGALLNSAQRGDPTKPQPMTPGQPTELAFEMHFTTWTFRPGHRIRLAVTNAQFPMVWPTAQPMTMTLHLGEGTSVSLPTIPAEKRPTPSFAAPQEREHDPIGSYGACADWPSGTQAFTRDLLRGQASYEFKTECNWTIAKRRYRSTERNLYVGTDARPGVARFRGDESHEIGLPGRSLTLRSVLEVRSDETTFFLTFTRRLFENDVFIREKQWSEEIPRDFQ